MFKALGDPTRLSIFQFLRSYCCATMTESGDVQAFDGPTISEVCGHVMGEKKISTSMSFHIKELRNAGLIHAEKRGKNVMCCVNSDALSDLISFLSKDGTECC